MPIRKVFTYVQKHQGGPRPPVGQSLAADREPLVLATDPPSSILKPFCVPGARDVRSVAKHCLGKVRTKAHGRPGNGRRDINASIFW